MAQKVKLINMYDINIYLPKKLFEYDMYHKVILLIYRISIRDISLSKFKLFWQVTSLQTIFIRYFVRKK